MKSPQPRVLVQGWRGRALPTIDWLSHHSKLHPHEELCSWQPFQQGWPWALSTALLFRPNVYFKPFDSCGEHIGWAPGPRMLLAGFSFHYFPICKVGENSSNGWLWRQTVKTQFLLIKYCKFTVKHHRRAQCAVGTSHITGGICWQFIPQPLHPHPSQEHGSPYPPAQPQRRQQLK